MTSPKCTQHDCNELPIVRFTWPGKDESYACYEHGRKLQAVAQAIGLHLQLIPLDVPQVIADRIGEQS